MRIAYLLAPSLTMLVSFQTFAATPVQIDQVKLTVLKDVDHLQLQCLPISLATALHNDWKKICNDLAVQQVQKLAAAGTIAAVKAPVFDTSVPDPAAGPMLLRNIALSKPQH